MATLSLGAVCEVKRSAGSTDNGGHEVEDVEGTPSKDIERTPMKAFRNKNSMLVAWTCIKALVNRMPKTVSNRAQNTANILSVFAGCSWLFNVF